MSKGRSITVSSPGKIHLLGEHAVVYGKPAILTSLDLRAKVTISQGRTIQKDFIFLQKIIEKIIKKELKLKKMPLYSLNISSKIPLRSGLGSSASLSSAYIGALLTYLRVTWNLQLINKLAYEAEKVFHGNPSGGDNSTVVYGRLIWFRKESPDLKIIHPLDIIFSRSKNFVLIQTGTPNETTAEMVALVKNLHQKKPKMVNKILEDQERLVKELLPALRKGDEKEFKSDSSQASLIKIIKEGEKNLESLGVVSKSSKEIIREIENAGGAAKICGAGGKTGPTGVLLCYHGKRKVVEKIAKAYNLPYFSAKLGVEGVRIEK